MRLALFDLDNTLVDRTLAFERAARLLAADHGLDPAVAVPVVIAADNDGRALWEEWFVVVRDQLGLGPSVEELIVEHRARYIASYVVDEPTVAALGRLREAGWRIGVVTNGPPSQEEKILATGLDTLVDGWAVSDVVGARKPDPRIFAAAAAACGAALDGGWMVGDWPPADIAGAHQAGLTSVWLHRGRRWADVAFAPDAFALRRGDPAPELPADFAPDHIADDIPAAVDLMLTS